MEAFGDASLTRRAPATAVTIYNSSVAVTILTRHMHVRANFVHVPAPEIVTSKDNLRHETKRRCPAPATWNVQGSFGTSVTE